MEGISSSRLLHRMCTAQHLRPSLRDFQGAYPEGMEVQLSRRISKHAPKFPNTIREYRLRAGFSQRHLARLLGRGRNAVSSWERGLTLPSVPKLLRMAKLLSTLAEGLYWDFYSTAPRSRRHDLRHA